MDRMIVIIIVMVGASAISRTSGEVTLSEITLRVSGIEQQYSATVYQANNTEMVWFVNGFPAANSFIDTETTGYPDLTNPNDPIYVPLEDLYGFSYKISGMDVTSTLTIKNEDGYGDVMVQIKNANKTFSMTSLEGAGTDIATTEASTSTANVLTVTSGSATSVGSVTSAGMLSSVTPDTTVAPPMTSPDNVPTTTFESTTLPMTSPDNVPSSTIESTALPMTSPDENSIVVTSESTASPVTSSVGVSATTSQATVLPDCDVGGQACYEDTVFNCTREVTMESCTVSYKCKNESYKEPQITCQGERVCISPGVWGVNCNNLCGRGCPTLTGYTMIHVCDITTGRCVNKATKIVMDSGDCADGWMGEKCETPICHPQHCNGGVCLAPNFCGNCPRHYESGVTCRNISLDGFTKGSLGTLAILAAVVIVLKLASNYYEGTKKKKN